MSKTIDRYLGKKVAQDEDLQAKCEKLEHQVWNGLKQIEAAINQTERISNEMIRCIADMSADGYRSFGVQNVKREHDELFRALHDAVRNTELAGGL